MNLNRLLELSRKLLDLEKQHELQAKLIAVRTDLDNISSNPAEPTYQASLVEHLKALRSALKAATSSFTPVEQDTVDELISGSEFSLDLNRQLKEAIDQNALTPSVARDNVQKIESTRATTIEQLKAMIDAASFFGWEESGEESGGAIIEFTVPRTLFGNQFSRLVQELDFLKKLVALIAEASGEEPDAELVSLSTTDPTIAVAVTYGVAIGFGKVVNWGLGVWKQVEEIRALRTQAKKVGLHSEEEMKAFFDTKIEATIDAAVKSEAKRLTEHLANANRANEITNGLEIFLKPFLARMERGLTVDIKLLPHAAEDEAEAAAVTELNGLAATLVFPAPAKDPILALTSPEAVKLSKARKRSVKRPQAAKGAKEAPGAAEGQSQDAA